MTSQSNNSYFNFFLNLITMQTALASQTSQPSLYCPSCQQHKNFDWVQKQKDKLLPVHHFMVVFTVPQQVRSFIRSHQRICYIAMFKAVSNIPAKFRGCLKLTNCCWFAMRFGGMHLVLSGGTVGKIREIFG